MEARKAEFFFLKRELKKILTEKRKQNKKKKITERKSVNLILNVYDKLSFIF